MKIRLRNSAIKDLKMLSQTDKQRIHGKIMELENFPQVSNLKKLTNFEPAYRAKVGNYRILFDVLDETIEIGRVLTAKKAIENKDKLLLLQQGATTPCYSQTTKTTPSPPQLSIFLTAV